ncbi:hypothetical protein Glo7428_3185 [Gloeocapsa sp. PCC 7428]|uniref:hypothetical protein n=1 Tax=Gloeocapsa sp. PCC 7428 TaxID=1173026 RepID=UPI0002A5C7FB|nr:hypothetical protein [Gloeocapsa sp. PCC 7428]AFZ31672.1 hypothetical protein Glo7428_3185 [Gloeocapsa sp. PCC 7428]
MLEQDLIHSDLAHQSERYLHAIATNSGNDISPFDNQTEQKQSNRIHQLEQALEQSLTYLAELRRKLKTQALLEAQLAAVEEIANLQKQVISKLQQQQSQVQLQQELHQNLQQTAILQEQIIQQSQQVGEYVAAVHYWKEQYLESVTLALELKEVIERLLPDRLFELNHLLTTVQSITQKTQEVASTLPTPTKHASKVDLPPFLK